MMETTFMQIVMWALPSGFVSSVVTWMVTRRQRNNDFIARLQDSINLLTEKYTETLNENVQLKSDNARMLAAQTVMEEKIDSLNRKIDCLTQQLKMLQNEKTTNVATHRVARSMGDELLRNGARAQKRVEHSSEQDVGTRTCRRTLRKPRHATTCGALDGEGLDDDRKRVCGDGAGSVGDDFDSAREPP
jgi:polyhydroxyalkanoate synthesis regulator phasin